MFATKNLTTGAGKTPLNVDNIIDISNTEKPISNPAEMPDNTNPVELRSSWVNAASSVCCKMIN